MEVPVPREAQSIVFSQVFLKSILSLVPLHPASFSLCWQRWRDRNPSSSPGVMETGRGGRRCVGLSSYKPAETPCSSSEAGVPLCSLVPCFWWVNCTSHPKDCPQGRCVHRCSSPALPDHPDPSQTQTGRTEGAPSAVLGCKHVSFTIPMTGPICHQMLSCEEAGRKQGAGGSKESIHFETQSRKCSGGEVLCQFSHLLAREKARGSREGG